jgi:5-methylcytosine-specific restriction endonuclease McrA
MLVRQVAVVEETEEGRSIGPFPFPKVVRLLRYVYLKFNPSKGPRYSRTGVLRRDNYCCAYCGKHATTIDHVVPRSKGGKSTWVNSVAACRKCNEKKADKTLEQTGMKLRFKPFVPTFFDLSK